MSQISCLIAMFSPNPPNPYASAACLMFAKSSVCWNPIIYLILNPQFQSEFQSVFRVNLSKLLSEGLSCRKTRSKLSTDRVGYLNDFHFIILIRTR